MTELRHYDRNPVVLDRSRWYPQPVPRNFGKPYGLWVSILGEDDWHSWCTEEEYCIEDLRYEHIVTLEDDDNILRLSSPEAIDAFYEEYQCLSETDHLYDHYKDIGFHRGIDWRRVADEFDGIIIAPYQWDRRNSHDWYYGWDCASGCIWNLSVIKTFDYIPHTIENKSPLALEA